MEEKVCHRILVPTDFSPQSESAYVTGPSSGPRGRRRDRAPARLRRDAAVLGDAVLGGADPRDVRGGGPHMGRGAARDVGAGENGNGRWEGCDVDACADFRLAAGEGAVGNP
jgi:hypothetical protein